MSTVGAQAGTPAYMAPEMFDGAPVSEKVSGHSREAALLPAQVTV